MTRPDPSANTPRMDDEWSKLERMAMRAQKARTQNARWSALDDLADAAQPATILALIAAARAAAAPNPQPTKDAGR